jgi:hypothetical protein
MSNMVRIIAQSDILNIAEVVNECDAENRLEDIRKQYNQLLLHNKCLDMKIEDAGLLVTTTLIKG